MRPEILRLLAATRRLQAWVTVTLACAVLAGCAAQLAFRDGQDLIARGKVADGLSKLEEANRLDPRSAEYRITLLQARDHHSQALIERADDERTQGRYEQAEHLYREALALRNHQDRAIAGLRLIDKHRHWDEGLKSAQEAIGRNDWCYVRHFAGPVSA